MNGVSNFIYLRSFSRKTITNYTQTCFSEMKPLKVFPRLLHKAYRGLTLCGKKHDWISTMRWEMKILKTSMENYFALPKPGARSDWLTWIINLDSRHRWIFCGFPSVDTYFGRHCGWQRKFERFMPRELIVFARVLCPCHRHLTKSFLK